MNTLIVGEESFLRMLPGLINSGVRFEAREKNGFIIVEFSGGI